MTTRALSVLGAKVIMAGAAAIAIADSEKGLPSKRKAPGDDVQWIDFPSQNDESNADWGDFLTDIARHLPSEYGNHYYSDDRITHAHETTHGINSHLSNHVHRGRHPAYGFYVGNNRAVLLDGPRLKLSQVAEVIPESLRGSRYQLYCIDQQKYFEDHPLYLFDEWVAYTNGAHAGVELVESDRLEMRPNDAIAATMEFSIYALSVAAAAQKHDPDYARDNKQFREFLAHELRRSLRIYKKGSKLDAFRWNRKLERNLLEDDDADELRQIVPRLYGKELTLERLLR